MGVVICQYTSSLMAIAINNIILLRTEFEIKTVRTNLFNEHKANSETEYNRLRSKTNKPHDSEKGLWVKQTSVNDR